MGLAIDEREHVCHQHTLAPQQGQRHLTPGSVAEDDLPEERTLATVVHLAPTAQLPVAQSTELLKVRQYSLDLLRVVEVLVADVAEAPVEAISQPPELLMGVPAQVGPQGTGLGKP